MIESGTVGRKNPSIDVRYLEEGIYILRLKSNQQSSNMKFSIAR